MWFQHHPQLSLAVGAIWRPPRLKQQKRAHEQREKTAHLERDDNVPGQADHERENSKAREAAASRDRSFRQGLDSS
jgi:hypothetical protein